MPSLDVTSTALSAGSKVGRAFSVVSLIPSVFLVVLIWAVIVSGAVTGAPDRGKLTEALGRLSPLGAVAATLLLAFVLGYVLHPVQFALTQLLEGYWGTSKMGMALMARGVRRYRRLQARLSEDYFDAEARVHGMDDITLATPVGDDPAVPWLVARQQLSKALGDFPEKPERVMPTRFGNVLRRHEDMAGKAYGLPGVDVIPPLTVVGDPEHNAYLAQATEQLDAAVSVFTVTALATVIVAASTITDGWWLLSALVPYALCVIAYKGAISVAHSYGNAMRRLVDLDRFALYEALHLHLPLDALQEREVTASIVAHQLAGRSPAARYFHPSSDPTS